ncbi:U6 snRNP-associated protein Lsm7 [Tilletia horrida]|uniref:U6 snRNP-associated protein Lsm7 n=1 Tax=Tilletia horrida TaxID=155126 RepID=A0AAN6JTE9_9BASI|nr:U6 snRNP-associated protein Lsm7 [Tilletia horrida]KAK0554939.1 U6 snRNP-associated protein Lsm7 [Tilletia horrida]KAK0568351.1 U6 snRNP-associated protein Lsm7 [Tilletia horrida]
MADRGSHRGGGGGRGRGGGPPGAGHSRGGASGRGGAGPSRGGGGRGGSNSASSGGRAPSQQQDRPKRDPILDLSKYSDKSVRVKLAGGREVTGTLKGFDQLMNLVLDDVTEFIKDPVSGLLTKETRSLGLVVLRGTAITVINPADGFESIENPFAQPQ